MMKKIALLFMLVLNIVFVQNTVQAQGEYDKDLYMTNIQKKIEANWIIPSKSTGKSAVISILLDQDGFVTDAEILRTSNDDAFDKSAIDAVFKPRSFGPLVNGKNTLNIQFFFSPIFTSMTTVDDTKQILNPKNSNIVNVANTTPNTDLTDYTSNLVNQIYSNWNPKSKKHEREAIADIKIGKDGTLKNISLIKSSNNCAFNKQILDTISNSLPVNALPAGYNQDDANIRLNFQYSGTTKENKIGTHDIRANVKIINGYDKYTKQVEDVIADSLKGRRVLFHKDLLLEMTINKNGQLKYVKVKTPSKDKNFDRTTLSILQKTSFPPIPQEMGLDNITLNYEVVTQRGYTWRDFLDHYILHLGTTELKSFCN